MYVGHWVRPDLHRKHLGALEPELDIWRNYKNEHRLIKTQVQSWHKVEFVSSK